MAKTHNSLYLGRTFNYPIALEGALKLKEISYVHAEGYASAEMKHGPIALIDKNFLTVIIAVNDSMLEKNLGNISEIKARNGKIIAVSTQGNEEVKKRIDIVIEVPETIEVLYPFLSTSILQLLAYHTAVKLKKNVDELAEKLEILIKDKKLRDRMGKWGLEEVKKYDLSIMGKQILNFYKEVFSLMHR